MVSWTGYGWPVTERKLGRSESISWTNWKLGYTEYFSIEHRDITNQFGGGINRNGSGAFPKWGLGMIRHFCEFQTFESSEQSLGPQWVVGTVPTGRLFFRGMKLKTRDYGNLTNFVEDIWKPQLGPWGLWNHRKIAEICNSPSAFLYTICLNFLQYINRQKAVTWLQRCVTPLRWQSASPLSLDSKPVLATRRHSPSAVHLGPSYRHHKLRTGDRLCGKARNVKIW